MLTQEKIEHFSEYFGVDLSAPLKKHSHLKNPDKSLVISDLHSPYHEKSLFEQTIKDNTDCKDVILPGDAADFYSMSHYRKSVNAEFRDEFRGLHSALSDLSANFDNVYFMLSNHDTRLLKYMYDKVPEKLLPLLDVDLLPDLLKTIPNLTLCKQNTKYDFKLEYIWQYRDVIFTHVEQSSVDIGKVVQEIAKKLPKWEYTYNLRPYRAIFQGHNHISCKIKYNEKVWLYQLPCMIDYSSFAFDYTRAGRLQGNPPALGHAVLEWTDNKFNPNKSYIYDYEV